jgi:hypothetical protein
MGVLPQPLFNLASHSYNTALLHWIFCDSTLLFVSVALKRRYSKARGLARQVVGSNIDSSLETFITRQFCKPQLKRETPLVVFGLNRC